MTETKDPADSAKANLANLSKIPASEFEKHFHEWMERDDVARGLQAKLRCDLIKNFNKTTLGKQVMAHTMSSTGGTTYRLTLTPVVLALNTLVSEFLYAQNCHFTLSVFCTEVPFRNTLPDFDSMRNFRFNEREISEIWEAVTNAAAHKQHLDPSIVEDYETNPNNSLLLLFLKSLINQKPVEMLRKSIEIQTEPASDYQQKLKQRSCSIQVTPPPSPPKSRAKAPDNVRHINKYLLILSQKVTEMTKEFESLVKQRELPKSQRSTVKTARSRELHTLNRSLDRINENVKQLTKTKRKGKRLTNVVESIDCLTKQFGKCAENFGQVTRELCKKEKMLSTEMEGPPKVIRDIRTEETSKMDTREKSYADWLNEMRTTANGKKFLERVDKSVHKAVAKYQEQLQTETDIKMKHMKSLLKLHYKQKMVLLLSRQGSDEQTNATQKLNENIEMRLKQFEMKQQELVQQLRESSFELQEAQKSWDEEKTHITQSQKAKSSDNIEKQTAATVEKLASQTIQLAKVAMRQKEHRDVPTPRDNNVEQIICETKLRLQQLETESNCLEQHFQIYMDRRRRRQQNSSHRPVAETESKSSKIFDRKRPPTQDCLLHSLQSKPCPSDDDLDLDVEFLTLKEKLKKAQVQFEAVANDSCSPRLDANNVIREAKHKFFENDELFRRRKEHEVLKQRLDVEEQMTDDRDDEELYSLENDLRNRDIIRATLRNAEKSLEPRRDIGERRVDNCVGQKDGQSRGILRQRKDQNAGEHNALSNWREQCNDGGLLKTRTAVAEPREGVCNTEYYDHKNMREHDALLNQREACSNGELLKSGTVLEEQREVMCNKEYYDRNEHKTQINAFSRERVAKTLDGSSYSRDQPLMVTQTSGVSGEISTQTLDRPGFIWDLAKTNYQTPKAEHLITECKTNPPILQFNEPSALDSPKDTRASPRRELFPKEVPIRNYNSVTFETNPQESPLLSRQQLRQALNDLKSYTAHLANNDGKSGETSAELIKQSMTKMKQLFGEPTKSTIKSTQCSHDPKKQEFDGREDNLNTSSTTTNSTTSTANTNTNTSTTSAATSTIAPIDGITQGQNITFQPQANSLDAITKTQIEKLKSISIATTTSLPTVANNDPNEKFPVIPLINRVTNTTMPGLLNVTTTTTTTTTSDSEEESLKSIENEQQNSKNDDDECDEDDDGKEDADAKELRKKATGPQLELTPKEESVEIGEVLSETQSQFAAMEVISTSESSAHTDLEMDVLSTGRSGKRTSGNRLTDESESDFWA